MLMIFNCVHKCIKKKIVIPKWLKILFTFKLEILVAFCQVREHVVPEPPPGVLAGGPPEVPGGARGAGHPVPVVPLVLHPGHRTPLQGVAAPEGTHSLKAKYY